MIHATKFAVDPAWRVILNDLGVNERELLRRSNLPEDLFSRNNAALSTEEYFRVWRSLEKCLDDPVFPLKLGQMISAESFSPSIFAALCSPDLNVAMTRLSQYKKLIGPMALQVEKTSRKTTISFDCLYTDNPLPDSLLAVELVFQIYFVRMATREHIIPLSVSSKTALTHPKDYAAYFGVMPRVGETNQVCFSAEDSRRPFLTENWSMWQFFEPELRKRLSEVDTTATFASRVRSSLFELLPSGQSSTDDVAKKLAVSKRTLQRHLSNENTSFQQELNKTRKKLALHYLANSTCSGAEISFLLGFADPNSFVRAFRTWTGKTPEKVRAEMVP